MKFHLHYRGNLKSNGSVEHKHALRKVFALQLEDLWSRDPLAEREGKRSRFLDPDYVLTAIEHVGGHTFSSVVTKKNHLTANLDITLLRPGSPGVLSGGDIDNRMKTLFDALTIPNRDQIPSGETPDPDGCPIHCLLEDDGLITGVRVTSDRLLESTVGQSEVLVVIAVDVSCTRATLANLGLVQ